MNISKSWGRAAPLSWLFSGISCAGVVCCASAQPLNVNILVNASAETGPAAMNATQISPPSSWWVMGDVTQVRYGASGEPFLGTLSPRPQDAGLAFFAGGPFTAQSAMVQRIEVNHRAAQIDANQLGAVFSAWLGGGGNEEDTVLAFCTFLDSDELALGTLQLNGPNSLERAGVTLLAERSAEGAVPAGTRMLEIIILYSRASGTYNNAYADSISLMMVGPCLSDINLDGGIDGSDVDAFFVNWVDADPRADFNNDGGVDGADVSTFFAAWELAVC